MLRAKCCRRSDLAHSISGTPLSRCTSGTSTPLFHDFRNFAGRVLGCNLGLKCAHAQWEWCTARTGKKVVANVSETAKETVAEVSKNRRGYTDMQGAPRFPIKMPVALKSTSAVNQSGITGQGVSGKTVERDNMSANGVVFRRVADVPVGSAVDFPLSLPADVVGAEADVQVDCRGGGGGGFEDGGGRGAGGVL